MSGASAFPSTTNQGQCTTGTCQIWDSRLSHLDTILLNHGATFTGANGTFANGSACPSAIGGNVTFTDQASSPHTYLLNAIEVSGNGNGLCESGESCVYAPNVGAYQAEGTINTSQTCTFSNGTVTGVTMYNYPTNGG